MTRRDDVQRCGTCGGRLVDRPDLVAAGFDDDGELVEWCTLCTDCGGEWDGNGTEVAR